MALIQGGNVRDENDLLTEFERKTLSTPYKEYFICKRGNFFASIQTFTPLWNCFMLLDKTWSRELEDMRSTRDSYKMLPMVLYMNSHAKMRVAMELSFAACLAECHSIIRDVIESAAHAHRIFVNPALAIVWSGKNDDIEAFKREFWYCKEEKLFDGVPELLHLWKRFSDSGSHTNINSVSPRFVIVEGPETIDWMLNYTGVPDPEILVKVLFEMLLVFSKVEEVLFKDCIERLKLDIELERMRIQFHHEKERYREFIKKAYPLQASVASAGQRATS